MKKLLVYVLLAVTCRSQAETIGSIAAGTFFESNTFYQDKGDRGDTVFRIKPELKHDSDNGSIGLLGKLSGSYNKHLKFANQDYFDYSADLAVPMNTYGSFGGQINGDFQKVSDPAVTDILNKTTGKKTAARTERSVMGGGAGIHWRASALSLIKAKARFQLETYGDKSHQYLNNQSIEGSLFYDYQFLPETVFYMGGTGGLNSYPSGKKNANAIPTTTDESIPTQVKYDSIHASGRLGIRGRLAERTRVDASGALAIRSYAKYSGFSEPVFNLRVEEQFSPKDLLIAGYDYDVSDSKFSNFVIDQTTYIGYARILGDQVLLLGRLQYTYSSFSKPFKREDQRLGGAFRVDYSVTPKSKVSAMFDLDVLNSDQINTFQVDGITNYDAAYSYEFFKIGLEYTQYF